ncbi:MAG: CbtB domain-containing protein [Hyphomicrobium sp.]
MTSKILASEGTSAPATGHVSADLAGLRTMCAVAFLIGAGLVFTVGFAHSDTLHNAAHDTRHSLAYPCH